MYTNCPHCESDDVRSRAVIEHHSCGCIRPREAFEEGTGARCPECFSGGLSLDELTVTAEFVECDACGAALDPTVLDHTRSSLSGRRRDYSDTEALIAEAKRATEQRGSSGLLDSIAILPRALLTPVFGSASHGSQEEERV